MDAAQALEAAEDVRNLALVELPAQRLAVELVEILTELLGPERLAGALGLDPLAALKEDAGSLASWLAKLIVNASNREHPPIAGHLPPWIAGFNRRDFHTVLNCRAPHRHFRSKTPPCVALCRYASMPTSFQMDHTSKRP